MSDISHIPVEIIQKLTSSQAWEYMLVPCAVTANTLDCYGDITTNYDDQIQELMVIYNIKISIITIEKELLVKLLEQYYRHEVKDKHIKLSSVNEINNGQDFLMELISQAFDDYASDIHIETYEERCRVRFRIDGQLIERYAIESGNYAALVNQIKILANLDISERRLAQDGRILFNHYDKKFDVRVSSLPTIYGEKIVLRLLTRHIELLELSNLGFSEKQLSDYRNAIKRPYGLVLICGPTGSGKSTTLYATLRELNKEISNIVTIEDPVEYTLEGINQVQLKEDIGLNFSSALRTFLRQDPDIIMLGEIRDSDTAQMAIRSSLTGHLILSTIHTNSAWGSVARLADMGLHRYLISNTMLICVAQRLVRLLCKDCRESQLTTPHIREFAPNVECQSIALGCPKCHYTGYRGRRAIYEVIPIDNELATAIRNSIVDVEPMLYSKNITSLKQSAIDMFSKQETSFDEIAPLLAN